MTIDDSTFERLIWEIATLRQWAASLQECLLQTATDPHMIEQIINLGRDPQEISQIAQEVKQRLLDG